MKKEIKILLLVLGIIHCLPGLIILWLVTLGNFNPEWDQVFTAFVLFSVGAGLVAGALS